MTILYNDIKSVENNTIYCGDATKVLAKFSDNSIDFICTSPPYDGTKLRKYNGFEFNFEEMATQIMRVLKPGGVVVWVVGDSTIKKESLTSFKQAIYFDSIGLGLHDTMMYEKAGVSYPAIKGGTRYTGIFEYMFVFSKGKPKTAHLLCDKVNRWEGWASFGKPTQRFVDGSLKVYEKGPTPQFSPRNNIWRYNTGGGYSSKDSIASSHPAIFPYLLPFDHIRTWTDEGDTVLDPMMGSGQTLLMAKLLNRKFIGIEISEQYCKLAEKRLANSNEYNVEAMTEDSSKQYNSRMPQDSKKKMISNNVDERSLF